MRTAMTEKKSILIVSSGEKSARSLASLLDTALFEPELVKTGAAARQLVTSRRFDLILINAPLSDEFGHELASDLARSTSSGVILLIRSAVFEEVSEQVGPLGVLTASKPLSPALFIQTIRVASAVSARFLEWEKENGKLRHKLEEARLVDRAKCLLIERSGLTEESAHRMLEKRAMDSRRTRWEVAEEVIREMGDGK